MGITVFITNLKKAWISQKFKKNQPGETGSLGLPRSRLYQFIIKNRRAVI